MAYKSNKKKSLSPEDFYSITTVQSPRIHPDETCVVYVRIVSENEGKKYKKAIYLYDFKAKCETRITQGSKDGDFLPRWSPDGTKLAFISTRGKTPQIFILEKNWSEARQLTSVKNGVQMFVWSPDSKKIAFLSRSREEERQDEDNPKKVKRKLSEKEARRFDEDVAEQEQMRIDPRVYFRSVFRQGTIYKDDRNTHIYIQKLDDEFPVRLTDGDFDFGPMCWSSDGKKIVTSTSKRAQDSDIDIRSDLVKIDVDSCDLEFLSDDENGNYSPRISPSGEWIYYLSFQNSDRHKQRMKIRRIPFNGGFPEEVTPDYDFDPHSFLLDKTGEWVYFTVGYKGRDSIARVSSHGGVPKFVVRNDGMTNEFHLSDNYLVYVWEAPDIPSDIFVTKINTDDQNTCLSPKSRITYSNKSLIRKRSISVPNEIWIDRPDGYKIQGWYMLPDGYEKGRTYPWIVQVHGGPHVMWGYSFWHEFQSMCTKGYGVYFSNPRGSDGYGSDFKGSIHLKWGEDDSKDILAGIEKMVELGFADPNKLFLTGGSFGGFMTAWIVSHDNRFKAAVAQRGVYNFISMYGASDALTLVEWEFDTLPWKNTELLWDRSPLKYIENITTPLMILHSEMDFRVGISQAEELYTALKREGKKTCLVRYPREGHELSRSGEPKHRVDRINRIIGWFDEHLSED